MRIAFAYALLGLGLGSLLLSGCGDDTEADTDTPAKPVKAAPVAAPDAQPQPVPVSVFLEYSGGMRGFMPPGRAGTPPTEFQRRIGSLLTETKVSAAVASPGFFLLNNNGQPQAQPYAKLLQTVEGLNPAANLGTELPQLLEQVMSRPGAERQVSVIVSDFIYGPEQKADFAVLPDLIRGALAPVSRQQLAVAVLGEKSRFYGTYHPAVKTPVAKRQLSGELVPYYIWAIGPPAQVSRYVGQVLKDVPAEQAYFGLVLPAPAGAALLRGVQTKEVKPGGDGSVYGDPNVAPAAQGTQLAADLGDGPAEFSVGLDLSGLPPAWQQPAYLRQQLQARLPQGQVALLGVQPLSAETRANDPALAAYTHAVRLRLSNVPKPSGRLTLALPAPAVPAWVTAWTTTNDNQPAGRTFALDQVLRGVRDCYPATAPVFSFALTVRND